MARKRFGMPHYKLPNDPNGDGDGGPWWLRLIVGTSMLTRLALVWFIDFAAALIYTVRKVWRMA